MAKKQNEKVKKASKVLETMSMSYEERWLYDARKFREWDERSLREYVAEEARKEGLEKGIQEGIEQGIEQGIQQGIKQGIEKGIKNGERKAKLETAKNMLKKGIDVKTIIEITGLSESEIIEVN